ncbi:alpha/beta fold hydrolase [Nocardia sp. SSK8]|uniref:alpha/beta fold hydrolase n=1 Tax=Nocardia sp. SSK8 TaxID=3120154 RepID=UPI003008DFC0
MGTRITTYTRAGLAFDVVDAGPLDGPVVVALHGFPQTSSSLAALTGLLADRGYRTVAPDQRGYSPGARPRGRRAYRLSELSGDIVALIEVIGRGPVHLVGHDWGAMVAWVVAANHPELVSSLVTISVPHPGAFLRSLTSSDQLLRSYYMGLFQLPALPEYLLRTRPAFLRRVLASTGMPDESIERVRAEIVDGGALTGGLNWYRALPLGGFGGPLGPVEVPVTHVWSSGDTALSRRGAELAGRYVRGDYRLVVLDGASHWLPEERPAELAGIVAERIESTRR